jgi:hypothetical protein
VTFNNSVLCDESIGHRIHNMVVIDRQKTGGWEKYLGLVFDPTIGRIASDPCS